MQLSEDLLCGAKAAAKFAGLPCPRVVYRLVEGGHLPAIRKGSRLFFLRSDIRQAFRSDVAR